MQEIEFHESDGSARLRLTRRDGGTSWVVIDAGDAPLVRAFTWHEARRSNTTYVETTTRREDGVRVNLLMHRLLAGASPAERVDHEDGNGLNNRRSNIRIASARENSRNMKPRPGYTSGFKGVSWSQRGSWTARINTDDTYLSLGCYDTEIEAALAYDNAARKYHGDFARTNFTAEQASSLPTPRRRPRRIRGGLPHGRSRYTSYGCRCDVCRAAESAYQRRRRDRASAS